MQTLSIAMHTNVHPAFHTPHPGNHSHTRKLLFTTLHTSIYAHAHPWPPTLAHRHACAHAHAQARTHTYTQAHTHISTPDLKVRQCMLCVSRGACTASAVKDFSRRTRSRSSGSRRSLRTPTSKLGASGPASRRSRHVCFQHARMCVCVCAYMCMHANACVIILKLGAAEHAGRHAC